MIRRLIPLATLLALLFTVPLAWAQDTAPAVDAPAAATEAPAVVSMPVFPPSETGPDYDSWVKLAERVEQALESGRVSTSVLESLRGELTIWRETLANARSANAVRISTLRAQINALGPKPENSGGEMPSTAAQRETLTQQLDALVAPVKRAELAHARADTLIGELDKTLRARQTEGLLELGPSPLNPALWLPAVNDLGRSLRLVWASAADSWQNEIKWAQVRGALAASAIFMLAGLGLMIFGQRAVRRAGEKLQAGVQGPARSALGLVLSIVQMAVPLLGVGAIVLALSGAFVLDTRGQSLLAGVMTTAVLYYLARWVANRVFGVPGATWQIVEVSDWRSREGRFQTTASGLFAGLTLAILDLGQIDGYSAATVAVLQLPLLVLIGLALMRIGRVFRANLTQARNQPDGAGFFDRSLGLLGTILTVVGGLGPVVAALGYAELGRFFLLPTLVTLFVIAVLLILHRLFVDLYGIVTRRSRDEAREALVPVLVSFGIAIAIMPLFFLIWGRRVTELTELWARIGAGIQLGDTVVTPGNVLTVVIVFALGFGLTRLIQGMLGSTILPKTKMDIGGQNAITSGVGYVGIFLAAVAAITSAGIDLSSLAIVAGALSVGIGFGLQNIVSNFVSGIILLIERPVSEGDWIDVGGHMGYVRDISVRSTRIETFDRTDVVVPNSDLISGVVTNYTRGNLVGRVIVKVGVGYGSDTKRVEEILTEIAKDHPLVAINPAPSVYFMGFGADSLDFEIRAILMNVNFVMHARSDMNHEIARRFREEGIEIPFAQRDIWLRNPETLNGIGAAQPAKKSDRKKTRRKPTASDETAGHAREALDEGDMPETFGYGREDNDD
jgi:small-conductance mechanosensitive channel